MATRRSPNLVFFFSDQQRWDTCGCYNQAMDITPNLDGMAKEGVLFRKAFTCQPVCGPARSCLQTGKYPTETGCFTNDRALPQDEVTIAHRLRAAGYNTGYVGKWHLASYGEAQNYHTRPTPPERRGGWLDYWMAADVLEFTSHGYDGYVFDRDMNQVDFKGYRCDCVTDFALDFLRQQRADQPFMLFLSHIEPHQQNDHNRMEGPEGSKERFASYPLPPDLVGPGDYLENWPDYLGCVNSLDYNLGRVRQTLAEQGLADNTLVIYTSDHGCHFHTRKGEYKRSCHESSIHVPLVISGPGFEGGKVVDELVDLMDLPPTLMQAADVDVPETMRGRPLQELTAGTARDWRQEHFFQLSETVLGRGVRTARWKYSVAHEGDPSAAWAQPDATVYTEDFLYDLQADPAEQHNLVTYPGLAEVRAELAERLTARMVQAGETEPRILPKQPESA